MNSLFDLVILQAKNTFLNKITKSNSLRNAFEKNDKEVLKNIQI